MIGIRLFEGKLSQIVLNAHLTTTITELKIRPSSREVSTLIMLHLRRSLLRALAAHASASHLATARNSRSFVTVINKAQNQSSFASLSRPQRAANLASTLRRSYATQDEESKKEESTLESAKESVEETAESVQESAKETAAQGAERAQDGAESSMAAVRGAFESVKDAGRSAAGYVTDTADSFARSAQSGSNRRERGKAPTPEGEESNNLYLGNLYFEVDADRLQKEFEQFGVLKRVSVIKDARGLSKGFGYVEFEDRTAASNARNAFNGEVFEGRRLVVQYASKTAKGPPRQSFHNGEAGFRNPPSKTLYIGNMSFEMSDKDLNDLFRGIQNVLDVRVAIDRRTGQPRGFAHADFIDVKSAEAAAEFLQEKEFHGRKLRIDFSSSANAGRT